MFRTPLFLVVLAATGMSVPAFAGTLTAPEFSPELSAVAFVPARPHPPVLGAVRYEPRAPHPSSYSHPSSSSESASPVQLHMGFFEPNSHGSTDFEAGLRGGPLLDGMVQLGVAVDWMHNYQESREVVGDPYYAGGTLITPTRILSSVSSDLLPTTAFMQVNLARNAPLIPYVGVAGGYQWLFLAADDYATGLRYDATFDGWTWQTWGGLAVPLSRQARLTSEVFYHDGDVSRDVMDVNGATYREIVDTDGVGMRFGISFGF